MSGGIIKKWLKHSLMKILRSFSLGKGLEGSHRIKESKPFYKKIAPPFLENFFAEIDVAFKKSDDIFCAFQVLNVDNLSKQKK